SHVAGRDATVSRDGSCLDHDQRNCPGCSTSEMYQMPIIRHALLGAVLTHGRHDDSIAELESTDRQRTQQINVRHASVVFRVRRATMRRLLDIGRRRLILLLLHYVLLLSVRIAVTTRERVLIPA